MTTSNPCLLLYPVAENYRPGGVALIAEALQQAGLIGAAIEHLAGKRYRAGPAFLQHISFLGCSPAVEFEPASADSEQFCHVGIEQAAQLSFRGGPQHVQVYCRQCRQPASDWQSIIAAWQRKPDDYHYLCPECGSASAPQALNWRKTAAFAHVFVVLYNIYPHEAVPTDGLLNVLRKTTGVDWRYIYIR